MALTNLPYDDDLIITSVTNVPVLSKEVRDVQVDFTSTESTPNSIATITATITWTVAATDAERILDAARPNHSGTATAPDVTA